MKEEIEIISNTEAMFFLTRKLMEISIYFPKKECEKISYIISRIENIVCYPNDIRMKRDYEDN